MGVYLKSELENLMDHRLQIGDVRGHGLMLALELVKDRTTKEPLTAKETNDININLILLSLLLSVHSSNIRLTPPLIIDEKLADEIVQIIDRSMDHSLVAQVAMKARLLTEFTKSKLRP
jgi:4-aminobutyrate aminotransferase-like enzyme